MDPILTTNILNVVYEVSTLAVVVLGLAVVFGLLGVMNLAHGEFVMIGAYCAFFVQAQNLPFLAAVPLALLVCAVLGLVVERLLVRPLYARPFDTLLATWGLSMLLREAVEAVYGRGFRSVTTPLTGSVDVFGADYPSYRLLLTIVSIALVAGLVWWFVRSATGRRIRAVVNNPELAGSVGIPVTGLARNTFVFGCCLAALAGVMLAPLLPVNPTLGLDFILKSFFVLVVGGLGSLVGLISGSGVIGGVESVVSAFLDRTYGYTTVLIIAILFLWLRPNGLFPRT
ncbi:MAG: branched-chain amino acid ABC transporter permease [Rhodospirillaceae bacterium]|nr:branched-chain amino acid ABC transporter permease [Rhodospirillaceae bacterium]MYH36327.1 branched-chain amino acid ABC transporter permease [Rhodospirillaceae bacterium]MYK12488.1 branched-chain amino acid ABC transporter permease [Rhodospirillaceae bacterium]